MAGLIITALLLTAAAGALLVWALQSGSGRIRRAVAFVAALVLLGFVYGVAVEPRFVLSVQTERATIPDLPEHRWGERIAVLADLQIGMWWDNRRMARRAVARIVEEAPAAVLIAGDFVYGSDDVAANVEAAVAIVAPLTEAGLPTFAVLGNHDLESGAGDTLREALEAEGIRLLSNDAAPVGTGRGRGDLQVVGVAPRQGDRADPDAAFAELPPNAPRVVLLHDPDIFERLPEDSAPLAVAGHTHGGQLRVPGTPQWSYLGWLEDHTVHADGWIADYGAPGNRLFVNRGIGMSAIPMRLNCSPAITLFTLEPR